MAGYARRTRVTILLAIVPKRPQAFACSNQERTRTPNGQAAAVQMLGTAQVTSRVVVSRTAPRGWANSGFARAFCDTRSFVVAIGYPSILTQEAT